MTELGMIIIIIYIIYLLKTVDSLEEDIAELKEKENDNEHEK